MRTERNRAAVWVVLVLLFVAVPAFADEFHYNNILVGERATGMGGAYTALSDDPSGLFYNPAGIVYSRGKNLSASVNAYHVTRKRYSSVIGGQGWNRNASALLPNFFGIMQTLGRGKIGLSYAVTDSIIEDQDQTFSNFTDAQLCGGTCTKFTINLNNQDTTYNVGPSYGLQFSDSFSAGVTLYLHQRRSKAIMNQFKIIEAQRYQITNFNFESTEYGVRPIAGIMWSPVKKLALGVTASKTQVFYSDFLYQMITDDNGSTLNRAEATSSGKRKYPLTATFGAAYFHSDALLFSGDVSYYGSVGELSSTVDLRSVGISNGVYFAGTVPANLRISSERVATWNASVGTEYYLSGSWAMRGGLFTNRSNTPTVKANKTGQDEHVNLYGGSLSLSYFSRGTSLSLGGSYSRGKGKAQVVSGSSSIQNETMQSLSGFLSASYIY